MLRYKQYDKEIVELVPDVGTDGCLFMSLADIGCCVVGRELFASDIERLYWYAVPKYMEDGGIEGKNKCLILNHEEIIRIAGFLLGHKLRDVRYLYRKDRDKVAGWSVKDPDACNYFVAQVPHGKTGHFLRVARNFSGEWETVYNPGTTDGERISIRGYYVRY